ncbi:PAS domain S-box protein [Polyangium jinanense]|uniref:PAS domain S-box protein n=1 Tax=Polyangium jinanense TaxID=2829994 RepID=A0A9X3WY23_9BACT|nr:PAS domain S-box protein [Polyangium jinanense]MDC3952745.1 PAS domain S-box protein [Polyangium jinanense]MDC3980364.1 PAS domain S-box protein [Polyangium jinanense]
MSTDTGVAFLVDETAGEITRLREENRRLREDQRRLAMLVEVTNDWIWEVDTNGVYTFVSQRIRDFLGYEPEEALGKTPLDFMPPEEAARVGALLRPILAARAPFKDLENVNRHKDGRHVVLETSGVPLFDEAGTYCGYRGVDRDVTMRKLAESERARMQEEIIRAQESMLEELETPLLPVAEGVLVMPLIGSVDKRRAGRIVDALLAAVSSRAARFAIIDLTGLRAVDHAVLELLCEAVRGARLLGAEVLLTGVRAEVARKMVELDVGEMRTLSTLARGITFALGAQRRR